MEATKATEGDFEMGNTSLSRDLESGGGRDGKGGGRDGKGGGRDGNCAPQNEQQSPTERAMADETEKGQGCLSNRFKMLIFFIALKLVVPVFDIGTDIYTGVCHLLDGSTSVGGITLGIICLPFILALLIDGKNLRISVFYHLPFARIVKNLTILEKLFKMDTDNSHQSAKKDKLLRESAELSSYEAFCESAPQMIVQLVNIISTGGIGIVQAIGMVISYFALTKAATTSFFLLRDENNADVNPNKWLITRVLPAMAALVMLSVVQWSIIVTFFEFYSFAFFVAFIVVNCSILFLIKRISRQMRIETMSTILLSSVLGMFVPCIVGKSKLILKTTLIVTFTMKTALVIIALAFDPFVRSNILICRDANSTWNTCNSWSDCVNNNFQKTGTHVMDASNFNWTVQREYSDFNSCFADINRLLKDQNITMASEQDRPKKQRICLDDYGNLPVYIVISIIHICGFCAAYSLQYLSEPENLYKTWISSFFCWVFRCQTEYYHHILIFSKLKKGEAWNDDWKLNDTEMNRQDHEGNSFLHIGIMKGTMNEDNVTSLKKAGLNVNCQNREGKTVLMLAYQRKKIELFKCIFFEMSADGIKAAEKQTGDTILHWVFRDKKQDNKFLNMLLKRMVKFPAESINFNVANNAGVTPIVLSIERGDQKVFKYVLACCKKHLFSSIYMHNPLVVALKYSQECMFAAISEEIDLRGFFSTDSFSEESLLHNAQHRDGKYIGSIIARLSKELMKNQSESTSYIIDKLQEELGILHTALQRQCTKCQQEYDPQGLSNEDIQYMNSIEILIASVNVTRLPLMKRTALFTLAAEGDYGNIIELILQNDNANKDEYIKTANELGNTPLALASERGSADLVKKLLDNGADVGTANKNGSQPLAQAAEWGNVHVVTELLGKQADIYATDKNGYTPLACAARGGMYEIVEKLLEGQNSKCVNISNRGEVKGEALQLLLDRIEKIKKEESNGVTNVDLRKALIGDIFVNAIFADVKTLIALRRTKRVFSKIERKSMQRLADFNITLDDCKMPLELAIRMKKVRTADQLWNLQSTITETNHRGNTPLTLAAQWGNTKVVTLLLRKNSDIDLQNEEGFTPLALAALWGKDETVQLLLDNRANINLDNKDGYTPLALVAQLGNLETVRLLLDRGADFRKANHNGDTPLALAAQQGKDGVISLLLDKHADLKSANKSGDTPLILAARHGHLKTVKLLVYSGSEFNKQGTNGNTAIAMAAQHGHSKIVELLVHAGADINKYNNDGNTPMALAVQWKFGAIVQILIDSGARTDIANRDGVTALQLAERNGLESIVRVLRIVPFSPITNDFPFIFGSE